MIVPIDIEDDTLSIRLAVHMHAKYCSNKDPHLCPMIKALQANVEATLSAIAEVCSKEA
jgi:hypothetical protein